MSKKANPKLIGGFVLGCRLGGAETSAPCSGFNPHPTFLPGDASCSIVFLSIQFVSIHTRHFCRVMPLAWFGTAGTYGMFQSTPDISAG